LTTHPFVRPRRLSVVFAHLVGLIWLFSTSPVQAKSIKLRVVTYNVWGIPYITPKPRLRLERLVKELEQLRPDLVALQEVWLEKDSDYLREKLQASGLSFSQRFAATSLGSLGGAGLLLVSRYPLNSQQFQPFEAGNWPHTPWHLDWLSHKGVLKTNVKTPIGTITFANTHLQATYQTSNYDGVRFAQTVRMHRFLENDTPLIIAGDFNTLANEPQLGFLHNVGQLHSAAHQDVDAIMYRDNQQLHIAATKTVSLFTKPLELSDKSQLRLSDHDGILVDFELSDSLPSPSPNLAPISNTQGTLLGQQLLLTLKKELQFTWYVKWATRLFFPLSLYLAWICLKTRRQQTTHRRKLIAGALSLGLFTWWLLYMGFVYAPSQSNALQHAMQMLKRKPATSGHLTKVMP
jgi:endonuclease/exonuclease/phosphatase family metal-dependent hydrolase